jgi:hypothetical protein
VKLRVLIVGVVGCVLLAAAGCSSSSTSSQSTTTISKTFQVNTPDGQVSLSLDGKLPPNWPSDFPTPSGAKPAGSGSLGGSSSTVMVGVYTTSKSAPDTFSYYTSNPNGLTTSGGKSVGGGSNYVGSAQITAPHTGSVTVVDHDNTTYIVAVLKS